MCLTLCAVIEFTVVELVEMPALGKSPFVVVSMLRCFDKLSNRRLSHQNKFSQKLLKTLSPVVELVVAELVEMFHKLIEAVGGSNTKTCCRKIVG